jgi:hypothetical protein
MKVKPKFQIGDWVSVRAYVKFDYPNDIRTPLSHKLEKPIIGQIVGARMKFLGKFVSGGYDDQSYLAVSGSIIVWLVRDGYLNKPYEVLEEDVELHHDTHEECFRFTHAKDPKLPWRKTNMTWTESDKADLRKLMKDVPRDSKGRWLK